MNGERDFSERIGADNMNPLWMARRGMDLTRPAAAADPALWRFDAVREHVMAAGKMVSAEEAFRRVLVLENPAFRGEMRATNTLYAGLQLVLPGEIAPCHRHSQTALRFVIEGEGAYTAVDGERIPLLPGDFVITPCWSWHDHGNGGDGPVIWLDVLDTPLVGFLDTVFRETYPEPSHPITRPAGDTRARFGAGLAPMEAPADQGSRGLTHYPFASARGALAAIARAGAPDPCHGFKMQYVNPAHGRAATPTMGAYLQHLPGGFAGTAYRSTESTIFCAIEGTGRTVVDNLALDWGPRDIFAVPNWRWHHHEADTDAVLFSVSERPVQQALGLWREELGEVPA